MRYFGILCGTKSIFYALGPNSKKFSRYFDVLTFRRWLSISGTMFLLRDIYQDRGQLTWDREQRTGDKLQRHETGYRGRETRNRDVRQGTEDTRQGTETWDRTQRTGDMEQRHEKGHRGLETRNRDVRQGTKGGWQGIEMSDRGYILERSMGASNRVGTGLSYRPGKLSRISHAPTTP